MSKELNIDVGVRIRKFREGQRITREDFAEKVGLSTQFVADTECGRKGLSVDSISRICRAYNLSADYLILGITDKARNKKTLYSLQQMVCDVPDEYEYSVSQVIRGINEIMEKIKNDKDGK